MLKSAFEQNFLLRMPDGTVKQVNPFTGTQVWTVPGRGNRPNVKKDKAPETAPVTPKEIEDY